MDNSNDGQLGDSAAVALTGKMMVVAMILLFMVVVVVFFLHLYAKWFPSRGGRSVLASPDTGTGLDPSVLRSLPVVILKEGEGLECAVCLTEVGGEERARLLPKCKHGFHVECIDMWFQSHSTCPICRNPIVEQTSTSTSTTTAHGNGNGNVMLVIDIPNPSTEEEDLKSPMPTRFKRLLSKGKRVLSPSTSSSTSTCVEAAPHNS